MERVYGNGYWDKKYFWNQICWSCGTTDDPNKEFIKEIFDLSRELCPLGCPEENDLICLTAFQAGGCTKELEAKCLEEMNENAHCPPETGGLCENCHSYPC